MDTLSKMEKIQVDKDDKPLVSTIDVWSWIKPDIQVNGCFIPGLYFI